MNLLFLWIPFIQKKQQNPLMAGYERGKDKALETTGSRSRLNIVRSLNLMDISRTVICESDGINSENIVRSFCQLWERYPLDHKFYLILDGVDYYRSQLVKDTAYVLNLELHYLPHTIQI